METSGQQYSGLNKLQAHFCEKYKTPEERQKVVFIHFGVGNSRGYHLEKVAWNGFNNTLFLVKMLIYLFFKTKRPLFDAQMKEVGLHFINASTQITL